MAKFRDISDWEVKPYFNSGGTRNKKIIADSSDINYYFKESFRKKGKDFKFEFFSEIIASYLGKMIGLDVLEYEIAVHKDKIGCLSKSMNDPEEVLIEGDKYLKAYDPDFIKEDEKPGTKYTLQLIESAFNRIFFSQGFSKIVDVIIFDAIIGNSDRHQENWGVIANTRLNNDLSEIRNSLEKKSSLYSKVRNQGAKLLGVSKRLEELKDEKSKFENTISRNLRFAPIYDSGCCLGRELSDAKVKSMLTDHIQLQSYINRGEAEIHWEGQKVKHFDLLKKLIKRDPTIKERIGILINKFNETDFAKFMSEINDEIPARFEDHKLPEERKQLIIKLITSRINRIREIINE